MHGRATMQLGTKKIAASLVLLGGVAGAFLFRKPAAKESPEPGAATVPASPDPVTEVRVIRRQDPLEPEAPAPTPHLLGHIDPIDPTSQPPSSPNSSAPSNSPDGPLGTVQVPPPMAVRYPSAESTPSTPEPTPLKPLQADPFAPLVASQVTVPAKLVIHKVRDGDTLSSLARRYLGSSDRYHEIYDLNKDILKTPDLLPIGLELRIRTAFSDPSKELAD